jgi:hypothetical protein
MTEQEKEKYKEFLLAELAKLDEQENINQRLTLDQK